MLFITRELCIERLKTKQPAPPLPERIHHQGAHEQPHCDPDRNLDHAIPHIQHRAVHLHPSHAGCPTPESTAGFAAITHGRDPAGASVARTIGELISGNDTADQTTRRGESTGNLHEDGRQKDGGGEAVPDPGVQIRADTDGQRAQGLGDLCVGSELLLRVVVDYIAGDGEEEHRRHLRPVAVVDDDEAKREGQDEDNLPPKGPSGRAGGGARGVLVHGAVDGGAHGDAEAEE